MTGPTVGKRQVLGFAGLAVLALAVGVVVGVVAFGVFDFTSAPPPMDDLHVSNADDANHTVRIDVFLVGESTAVLSETVTLAADETVTFDGMLEQGRRYRLRVGVDDRGPQSFDVAGPDDLCTIEVRVDSNANVAVGKGCA